MTLLLVPEESDTIIARIKGMGRVQNFNVQTERWAQNGSGMSETAKVLSAQGAAEPCHLAHWRGKRRCNRPVCVSLMSSVTEKV